MKIRNIVFGGAAAAMASIAPAQPTAQADVATGKISNQYICVFKGNVSRTNVRAEASRAANPELGQGLFVYDRAIRGFTVRLPADLAGANAAMSRLKKHNANIAYCEQDQVVRALANDGIAETPWGVDRAGGTGAGYRDMTGSSKRAYVIDSGIDLDHPDLVVDTQKSFTCVKGRRGADDENGHGTHVAGTIAAKKNGKGVAGVAAGLPLVSVRCLTGAAAEPGRA